MSDVVWEPHKGSQLLFLTSPIFETLYEGTRGPGKTDALLMDFAQHIGKFGAAWRGILFREEYKELADVVSKSKKWFRQIFPGARFLESKSDYKWIWPDGEELLLRTGKTEDDYWDYHGHEYPWLGFEELTKWASSAFYLAMHSTCRSSVPGMPRKVRATCNPYGRGHNWVKRRFIDPAPAGVIIEEDRRQRVRIHGTIWENTHLLENDPDYLQTLLDISDPNKRKAWLEGDWNIVSGGALDDVWSSHCIVPRFNIPSSWRVDRSFDWGSSHPFAVGWWAQADGTEATLADGTRFCPPRGSLIMLHEWYGAKGPNEGLKLPARKVAQGIKEREQLLIDSGWVREIKPGPADNSIGDSSNPGVPSIAAEMKDEGVKWTPSDKSPGSRKNGFELLRSRLTEAGKDHPENPAIYFMGHCVNAIAHLPVLPRDPENPDDVDTGSEDHDYDMVRYRVLDTARITRVSSLQI